MVVRERQLRDDNFPDVRKAVFRPSIGPHPEFPVSEFKLWDAGDPEDIVHRMGPFHTPEGVEVHLLWFRGYLGKNCSYKGGWLRTHEIARVIREQERLEVGRWIDGREIMETLASKLPDRARIVCLAHPSGGLDRKYTECEIRGNEVIYDPNRVSIFGEFNFEIQVTGRAILAVRRENTPSTT